MECCPKGPACRGSRSACRIPASQRLRSARCGLRSSLKAMRHALLYTHLSPIRDAMPCIPMTESDPSCKWHAAYYPVVNLLGAVLQSARCGRRGPRVARRCSSSLHGGFRWSARSRRRAATRPPLQSTCRCACKLYSLLLYQRGWSSVHLFLMQFIRACMLVPCSHGPRFAGFGRHLTKPS